jgi:D-cysteine desulfhydrase family pyridoxal phosphate-dependent enzyme
MSETVHLPVPRMSLAALPTPLEHAPNLSKKLGVNLLVKRDDLTGLAMGGNKARKLEFLIADALAQDATMILATAAAQSNFCRMTAAAARKAGLGIGLLLRGTSDDPVQGNLLLDRLLGADIRFVANTDPYAPVHQKTLQEWADEIRGRGERPYIVNMHDGSRMGALVTCGYIAASGEMAEQCRAADVHPDHLYLAVGSGSTLAGLAIGTRHTAGRLSATRLVGVTVGTPPDVILPKVREFIRSTTALLGIPAPHDDDFVLDDSQRGPGYGVPTTAGLDAMRLVAGSDALLLNPVYTAKSFAALLADVTNGTIRQGETVIFLNTGGDPLLFSHAEALMHSAAETSASSSPV